VRTAYHHKLAALSEQIGQMCGLVAAVIDNATQALLRRRPGPGRAGDHRPQANGGGQRRSRAQCVTLLALSQPVAGEP